MHLRGADVFADEDGRPQLLVQAFEARRDIHGIAKSRVVHAFRRFKVTDDGLSDVNAKPREEWFQALRLKLSIENARMAQVIEVRDVSICQCSLVSAVCCEDRGRPG